MAPLGRKGILVVSVDTKPPNELFRKQDAPVPYFVGSDFGDGGRKTGRFLAEHLATQSADAVLVATGPEESWPAAERASWILYELAGAGVLDKCFSVELHSWDAKASAKQLIEASRRVCGAFKTPVIFTANDKIAVEFDRSISRELDLRDIGMAIVGYDGTRDESDELVVQSCELGLATIDTEPFKQGLAAAEFASLAYESMQPHFTKKIISPRVTFFGDALRDRPEGPREARAESPEHHNAAGGR